jgi:HD-GYP domain-containing protein (c-di-GMP phosphodiesterase class II)
MRSARLAPVNLHSIKLKAPLPFNLVDSRGVLLAHKGFIFETEKILDDLSNHGSGFFVNFSDRSDPQLQAAEKAYVNQLLKKLRSQDPLRELSEVHISYVTGPVAQEVAQRAIDWSDLVEVCNAMLHTRDATFFNQRLESLAAILTYQLNANPDEALMALFYLSEKEMLHYSASHCMLVCAVCVLTASTVLRWSESDIDLLMRCALTMNIGMIDLQDELTFQIGPTDISQQFLIREHPMLSVQILELFGVTDENWLAVVRGHHNAVNEPLESAHVSDRLIGLLNRADIFTARLSSRISRDAQSSTVAMKSIYFDTDSKIDAMGAAILKTVGIYRPGSFVKLATGEVAVVLRRGANTTTPTVAVVLNREGIPVVTVSIRNTADKKYAVVASVPSSAVHVTLNPEKMLALSRQ